VTVQDLREAWRTHFRVELLAEECRQQLEANPLFSVADAYDICDAKGKGAFTVNELRRLIEDRGFFLSERDAAGLMDKFDKEKSGKVNKSQFLLEMQPKSPMRESK